MVSVGSSIDPAWFLMAPTHCFSGKLIVERKSETTNLAKGEIADMILWCNASKLDQGGAGAAVVWKGEFGRKWQEKTVSLGKNNEILDAEIWGISEALKLARQKAIRAQQQLVVCIFCDAQTAINKLAKMDSSTGQALKIQIYQKADQLIQRGHSISVLWVLGHNGLKRNKRADKATKKAATEQQIRTAKWASLNYIKRQITDEKKAQICSWHEQKTKERESSRRGHYIPRLKTQIHPLLGWTRKFYASRFYQLKVRHGAMGTFFEQIGAAESATCWWCGEAEQSVMHLYPKCRNWRTQRRVMRRAVQRAGI